MFFNSTITKQTLSKNQIHLWMLTPQKIINPSKLEAYKQLLSPDELNKVERYRHLKAQNNAIITRAFVRSILALYTDQQPKDLSFTVTKNGKPELINTDLPLRFNISHNDHMIICTVCLNNDIGCDVENLNRKISVESIAKRYFSSAEYHSLRTLSEQHQRSRFFEYWTLKESFVKATGMGISQGLATFSFNIGKSKNSLFNDNIDLSFSENSPIQNSQNWTHSLIYPDKRNCIAISIHNENNDQITQIKQFRADRFIL